MTIETNPPAFPRPSTDHGSYGSPGQDGMTLRDYFAGQVISALIASRDWSYMPDDKSKVDAWATAAYIVADAMLTARTGANHGRD